MYIEVEKDSRIVKADDMGGWLAGYKTCLITGYLLNKLRTSHHSVCHIKREYFIEVEI